jgi:pimeloyl-ACP methyl ester carboxylesterase
MSAQGRLEALKATLGAGKFVETPRGRFHYARVGAGQPILLLHGWPEFWLTWRHNLRPLAEHFDVIAPDLRGFGESVGHEPAPGGPLTPDIIAEDIVSLLDAIDVRTVGLVAHDVGAVAAQTLARSYPERISRVFFFNCPHPGIAGSWADAESLPETWYQYFNQTELAPRLAGYNRDTLRIYLQFILSRWSFDSHAFDEDLELWVDTFMRPGVLEGGFAWYIGIDKPRRASIRHGPTVLPKINHPTRVLWGKHDPVLRAEWAEGLNSYFNDIQIDICDDAGHFVHYEQPERAHRAIVSFFSTLT